MKNMLSKFKISFPVVLFLMVSFLSSAFALGELNGKTFTGEIGNKGEGAGTQDSFVFKDGKFASTLCSTFGYSSGDYKEITEGDTINFESQITSANGGKMDWKGSVKGENLEGTFVTHENTQTSESWFKGTLKK